MPPEAGSLLAGQIHSIACAHGLLQQRLLRSVIASNAGQDVTVLSLRDDAGEFSALALPAAAHAAIAEGRLQLLHTSRQCNRLVHAHGPDVLFDELAAASRNDGGVLLLSHAERLFSPEEPERLKANVRALRAMLAETAQAALLLFSDEDGALLPWLERALDFFPQLAALGPSPERPALSVLRWQACDTLTLRWRYDLAPIAGSLPLTATGTVVDLRSTEIVGATDIDLVITTVGFADEPLPAGWTPAADLAAAERAGTAATAATVLLEYEPSQIEPLVRTLCRLRQACPPTLRIVVWAQRADGSPDAPVSSLHERLLTSAGAGAVLTSGRTAAAVAALLADCAPVVFEGNAVADADALLDAASPGEARGYLAPRPFVRTAGDLLRRSRLLDAGHALYRLPLRGRVTHLDVIRALAPAAAGELISADPHHLYIFLFGCPESQAKTKLQRLIGRPLAAWFDEPTAWFAHDDIEAAIETLRRLGDETIQPDFTAVLTHHESAVPAGPLRLSPLLAPPGLEPTITPARLVLRDGPAPVAAMGAPAVPDWFQNGERPATPLPAAADDSAAVAPRRVSPSPLSLRAPASAAPPSSVP